MRVLKKELLQKQKNVIVTNMMKYLMVGLARAPLLEDKDQLIIPPTTVPGTAR